MNLKQATIMIVAKKIDFAVRFLKHFYIIFLLGCGQATDSNSNQALFVHGTPLDFAPEPIRLELVDFFESLSKKDYDKAYEFSSERYRNTITKAYFKESFGSGWNLIKVKILSMTKYTGTFYLILEITSKERITNEKIFCVMFWEIKKETIKFKNMPFGPSSVRGFGEIPDFFTVSNGRTGQTYNLNIQSNF